MPPAPPRPLALREEPVAVLLLDTADDSGDGPAVLAADAAALALTGTVTPPADLGAFLRAAGLGDPADAPADAPWHRVAGAVDVPGELLPGSPAGDLWLRAVRVDGLRQTLVTVQRLEVPAGTAGLDGADSAEDAVVAGAGSALTVLHELPDARDRDLAAGPAWVVEWVDEGYTRTTGTPADEVVGRDGRHLLRHPDDATVTRLRARVETARSGHATTLDRRADGTAFLHRVSTTPLTDRQGRVRHVVSWHSDVTGLAAAEDAARRERETAAAQEAFTAQRLDLLLELDSVVVADEAAGGVLGGLRATARVLARDVVADALLALTVERPGGPRGVDAEIVAVAGERFAGLAGRRLRRGRAPHPTDPLLRRPDGARAEPVDLLAATTDAAAPSGWLATLVAATGARTAYGIPMVGRDEVVGLLVVVPRDASDVVPRDASDVVPRDASYVVPRDAAGLVPRDDSTGMALAPADTAVLVGAARRAGLLAENARLHAREHALAETLQRNLVAARAQVEGLDVWTHQATGAERSPGGGGWYDVLQTGPEALVVVVGDVVGRDVEAAAVTGQIRTVVRSAAQELDDPGSVVHRVDQLAAERELPRMASLVVAGLHRLDDGGWETAWSSAGHLPPLLRRASGPGGDGRVEVLSEATGTLVGVGDRPRATRERSLAPGDTLVLYTDGLIERPSEPARDGLEALVEALAASRALDAAGLGEDLLRSLGGTPEADAAVVVVRVPEDAALDADGRALVPADTPRRRRWQLPSEPSSVGKARHATLRASAVWGLTNGPQAEIVVSELVANAVLHGWGTVGLRLFDLPTGLRIEVEDESPEAPSVVPERPDGAGGHGMRVVERLGRWGWTPTRRGKIVWVELHPAPTTDPVPPPEGPTP